MRRKAELLKQRGTEITFENENKTNINKTREEEEYGLGKVKYNNNRQNGEN